MPPLSPDSSSSDASARVWMEAMVTRIEDDPDLLAALSDDEVDAALAAEGIRASGVRAAVRRRVREVQAMPTRSPARRTRFRPFMAFALATVGVVALASLWWGQQGSASLSADVLAYETTLTDLVRPPSKAPDPTTGDLLSTGAQALLSAARADPPDMSAARAAMSSFIDAHGLATSVEDRDTAAFFAGLANRLAGDSDAAVSWLRRVSADGAYGADAQETLDALRR